MYVGILWAVKCCEEARVGMIIIVTIVFTWSLLSIISLDMLVIHFCNVRDDLIGEAIFFLSLRKFGSRMDLVLGKKLISPVLPSVLTEALRNRRWWGGLGKEKILFVPCGDCTLLGYPRVVKAHFTKTDIWSYK